MTSEEVTLDEARRDLYEVMAQDLPFEEKAERALALGEAYLAVDNGHLTQIDQESNYWKAVASSDPPDGEYPAGLRLDLATTYCRRTIQQAGSIALHHASEQGWETDPAFETHHLNCYHGTPITVDDEIYGTVCFVGEAPRDRPFSNEETLFAELTARLIEHELQRERLTGRVDRLDQFASVVSHDLRNPLNIAQGRLSIAARETDIEHIETAIGALDRMQDLIGDVLMLARQGHEVDATDQVRLSAIVDSCWDAVPTGNAELDLDGELVFQADPDRVLQLFENLFRNAIEHGGTDVSVRLGALPEGDGFFVEDDGPGIPENVRSQVFETGFSTNHNGIGLGLSIVEGIVSAHGWFIRATEAASGGARFEITNVVTPQEQGRHT